jgi:hypothetical protein
MPREAHLFDDCRGSPVEGFLHLLQDGGNIPPMWIERSTASRVNRQKMLAKALRANSLDAIALLRDWELAYQKECFYYGVRVLLELRRTGKTKY